MEVVLKFKIFSLMLLLFIACSATTITTKADNQTVTVNKTVKVNKTKKVYKALKIKKSSMKNFAITSSKPKVAAVSSTGVVKGLKKGTVSITVEVNGAKVTKKLKVVNPDFFE